MQSKALIRLAKEIKINFQLILIALVCTLVAHGILYYWLKPPISNQEQIPYVEEQIPTYERDGAEYTISDLEAEIAAKSLSKTSNVLEDPTPKKTTSTTPSPTVEDFVKAFTEADLGRPSLSEEGVLPEDYGSSQYDKNIKFASSLENLNEFREQSFKQDLEEKTIIAFFLFFFGLCGGRYLFLIVRWVNRTSQLE